MTEEASEYRRPDFDFTKLRFDVDSESASILGMANSAVNQVIAWHSQELGRERRAGEPDQERIAELKESLAKAQADRRSIPLASDEQRQRLFEEYRAWNRRLHTE